MNTQNQSIELINLLPKILQSYSITRYTGQLSNILLIADDLPNQLIQDLSLALGNAHCLQLAKFNELHFDEQADLALIIVSPRSMTIPNYSQQITQALQRCRDLFARQTLVLVPIVKSSITSQPLSSQSLVAIGFQPLDDTAIAINDMLYQLWQYNVFYYKHLPDWLNSKFWANPENWNKYRW